MPRVRRPLPPELPHPVFSVAEALACGVTPGRLRGSDIERIRHGLLTTTDTPLLDIDILRALHRHNPDAVVVGPTAASLYRFPMPKGVAARPLHLCVPSSRRLRSDAVVRWRRQDLLAADVRVALGISLTTRVRTWADLGEHLSLWDLVVIGDHLVRNPRPAFEQRNRPYTTMEQLSAAADRSLRAANKLRAATAMIRVGSDSPRETRLRLLCVSAGLPEPVLNPRLPVPGSHLVHEPDLYWPEFQVSAQYDGAGHRTAEQHNKDVRRAERARGLGLLEVVITQTDMNEGGRSAVRRIRAACQERGFLAVPRRTWRESRGSAARPA